jgi:PAS domain S-box-containing protein
MNRPTPTGKERFFGENELIVSKTDLRGRIIYANDMFLKIADFTEAEVLGQPHSMIRHPEMPRCVFKLLWDSVESGREIFAYVVNMTKYGDHYWVFAHVTPTFDSAGKIVGYHSNRRSPNRASVATIKELYAMLLREEARHSDARKGMMAAYEMLVKILSDKGVEYGEYIFGV